MLRTGLRALLSGFFFKLFPEFLLLYIEILCHFKCLVICVYYNYNNLKSHKFQRVEGDWGKSGANTILMHKILKNVKKIK